MAVIEKENEFLCSLLLRLSLSKRCEVVDLHLCCLLELVGLTKLNHKQALIHKKT